MEKAPSYDGSGLVNLAADLEMRLRGASVSPVLENSPIPDTPTYVVVLFDGLGVAQLEHPDAQPFRDSLAKAIDAPFPTTTPVSLATFATALPPSQHGQVAHLSWYEDLGQVVNTLKWVTLSGQPVEYEYDTVMPEPNLWERLASAGREPITVQPGAFAGSPLSQVLYRGARFESAWDADDLVEATLALAKEPGRLIFTYVPFVDVAGHVFGQGSAEFTHSMKVAAGLWDSLASSIPPGATLIGTADHGLVEVAEKDKIVVRDPKFDGVRMAGDVRGVHVWGDQETADSLVSFTGAELVDPTHLIGPDPSAKARSHLGDHLVLAPPGKAIVPKGFDRRLKSYHGGLSRIEVEVPLLLG